MLLRQRSSCLGLARQWEEVRFLPNNNESVLEADLHQAPAYRRYARGAQKYYKPITTRLPFLSCILILTFALIAVVEIVLLQYPVDNDLGPLAAPNITRRSAFDNSENERNGVDSVLQYLHLKARVPSIPVNESSASSLTADPSGAISASTQTGASAATSTIGETFTPSGGTDISAGSGRSKSFDRAKTSEYIPTIQNPTPPNTAPNGYIPTFTSIPGAYIPTTQQPSVETTITLSNGPSGDIPTFTITSGAYVPTQTPVLGTGSVAGPMNGGGASSGADVSTGPADAGIGSQFATLPTSTINDPNLVATSLVPVATHTSGGMAVVVLGSPSETPLVPVSTYTSNGVALVVMGSPSKTSMVPVSTYTSNGSAFVVMGTPSETSLIPVSTMTSNGVAVVVLGLPTSQPTTSAGLSSGYSVVVEPITSTSGSVAYVYMTTMTLGPSQTATAGAPQNTSPTTSDQQTTTIAFTNMSYFAAWYLPTMVAVAFRIIWTIVYNNARMMEPFYRLASPAAVTGNHALDNL
jgi:hypothetical protein